MVWPSCRRKLRTQPTWSGGSPFSISDSATTGCQAAWLLKSRRIAHTRSIGASMTAERTTLIMARGAYRRTSVFRWARAVWKTPWPICSASAFSRSGGQSNSADHSAKVRLPSVTGVSFSVAM